MQKTASLVGIAILFLTFPLGNSLSAQDLSTVYQRMFQKILVTDFGTSNSPGQHGNHFKPSAREADSLLTPALNSLIASNISSFPLSSTSAGLTFDFSGGSAEVIRGSQGPLFAETGATLGKGKVSLGLNYNKLSLSHFRGLATKDIRFTFIHQDVGAPGLGDSPNENDLVNIVLNTELSASIFAFYATLGVTNSIDVGIAVPFVDVSMRGVATAAIESYTFAYLGIGNHFFSGDTTNPGLTDEFGYNETASGIGDVAIRVKANLAENKGLNVAGLVDVRLPTGDKNNFLGTGSLNVRALAAISKKFGDFTPHFNLGYEYRGADLDSDELEIVAGFDHKLYESFTFAVDFLGEIDLISSEKIVLFPDSDNPSFSTASRDGGGMITRTIDRSNIPDTSNDNAYNVAIGLKYASSDKLLLVGNILVPLNDSGLRSQVAPTLGIAFNF